MDPTGLMTLPVTVITVAETGPDDEYGNPTEVTTSTATVCWMHQTQRSEHTVDANVQAQTWQVYLPPATAIDGASRLVVDGITYQLDGPPWSAFNPRLEQVTHIEATVRRAA